MVGQTTTRGLGPASAWIALVGRSARGVGSPRRSRRPWSAGSAYCRGGSWSALGQRSRLAVAPLGCLDFVLARFVQPVAALVSSLARFRRTCSDAGARCAKGLRGNTFFEEADLEDRRCFENCFRGVRSMSASFGSGLMWTE